MTDSRPTDTAATASRSKPVIVGGVAYPARRLRRRILSFIASSRERGASARECVSYIYGNDEDGGPVWADHCIYVTAAELKALGLIYANRRRYYHYTVTEPKEPKVKPKKPRRGGPFSRMHRGKGRGRHTTEVAAPSMASAP